MKVPKLPVIDRVPFCVEYASGKRVLSVGLGGMVEHCDYSYSLSKTNLNWTFSGQLAARAKEATFLDLSASAIEAYRPHVNASYYRVDITTCAEEWPEQLRDRQFDAVYLGEVLEHLSNPGTALESLRSVIAKEGRLVATVPNAFAIAGIAKLIIRREDVHPEHVAYYSISTVTRLLVMAGYKVERMMWYRWRPLTLALCLKRPLTAAALVFARIFPQYSAGIVIVAKPNSD